MTATFRPIGYWVKQVDRLIDESFDRAVTVDGLTRRHWQVLNLLSDHPMDVAGLAAALAPFVHSSTTDITLTVDDLAARTWLACVDRNSLELTPNGRRAHLAIQKRVATTRRALAHGISAAEYCSAINILQRMASNLESTSLELAQKNPTVEVEVQAEIQVADIQPAEM